MSVQYFNSDTRFMTIGNMYIVYELLIMYKFKKNIYMCCRFVIYRSSVFF